MGAASRGHASWVQPKTASSASASFSNTTAASNTPSSASGATYPAPSTLLTKSSQQHLQQQPAVQSQGPKVTQDEASSYYAALTRPISPTMIMNYVPPPVSNSVATPSTTTATTPQGGSGSRSQPATRPALYQGARSSYMEPSNPPPTSSNQTPQQGRPLSVGGSSVISAISSGTIEDPSPNSSRFARRGPLTWKRCYAIGRFRGDAHPGILTLFKDNEHLFPIKTIDMAECFEVQVKAQDTKASGRFEFKLVTRKEETWFATDTMSERTGWIDSLNSLMSKAVGASLLKLEAKLNNIRHRNNSLEYSMHTDRTDGGNGSSGGGGNNGAVTTAALEGHLQLVQQDLATREQQLSQREQELERKRIESLLVQLEAWRAAAKVTVNQHYAVRDQLLERVMKTARTVQELLERARIHLETGSDQITEVVNSHLECIRVHASESSLNSVSYKMIKSILIGLSVNLDTRSSEMKRVLLVTDQFIHANKSSNPGFASNSSPASPRLVGARERRRSMGGPLPAPTTTNNPPPSSLGIGVYLMQVRSKYIETLELLEDHSKRLKRILERADINNPESARRFQEDVKEILKSLTRHPTYSFTPCLPDQPLPGAADTFYREDLVVIQQKSKELLRKTQASASPTPSANSASPQKRLQSTDQDDSDDDFGDNDGKELAREKAALMSSSPKEPMTISPAEPQSTGRTAASSPSPSTVSSTVGSSGIPKLNLALPASLSSFLVSEVLSSSSSNANAAAVTAATSTVPTFSSTELTQKLRDTILPEFDHLTLKQEESLQSMTNLLNQVSSALVKKLVEIKEATASQRQEFEELKDEIIDVMQLSATDPSAHQRDISALSEIRSKLADITSQLTKVQTAHQQQQQQNIGIGTGGFYGNSASGYRRVGGTSPSSGAGTSDATATGFSLLQRSASTMVHNSAGGTNPFYHTIDSGSRQRLQRTNSTAMPNRLQIPSSTSMVASLGSGGGLSSFAGGSSNTTPNGSGTPGIKPSKIAGMTRLFEDPWTTGQHAVAGSGTQLNGEGGYSLQDQDYDSAIHARQNQQVAAKLDQLLLLLEFVNTAQCRMMAYQDLEYDRQRNGTGAGNVDDGRMMAVQEHMEQMDRKMNLQMHLLRRLASIQDSGLISSSVGGASTPAALANIKQIDGDNEDEEVAESKDLLVNEGDLAESFESNVRTVPPENELTILEVLSRLDLQVIPSVKDQSERVQELSDQLSDMKRQLDEQHKRQELLLFQQTPNVNATARSRSLAGTSSNIGRSNSMERPVTPLPHSRSASQTLVQQQQQQQQQQASTSSLSSPLETESPASWRASLRPSQSNGSNSASFRDRILSASNIPPLPTSSSSALSNNSQIILQDSATAPTITGSGGGTFVTKTSDRIAELLDRMDNKMGQVIDEQLARYESGNKALLAKVFELLEADEESSEGDPEMTHRTATKATASSVSSGFAKQGGDQDETLHLHVENNVLLKDINKCLLEDRSNSEEAKQMLDKILREQEGLSKTNNVRPSSSVGDGDRDVDDAKDSIWADSLDRIKTLIQQEGDRSEASMSDQRDEILDKMNQVLSSIQDSQAQFGSRDGQVREELQELRDWMVRHSSLQTENLRELFLSSSAATASTQESGGAIVTGVSRTDGGDDDDGDFVERGSDSNVKVRIGDGDEEEYTEVDIVEDLDKHHHHKSSAIIATFAPVPLPVLPTTTSTDIQELKDQLEMFTKVQMATFSELADNVSGVEKMMRDMSKMMGVRRGGTILRRKEAEEGRAMLAMEVKETIQEVIGRMSSTTLTGPMSPTTGEGSGSQRSSMDSGVIGAMENRRPAPITTTPPASSASAAGAPIRGESGLFKYLYQARRSTSSTSTEGGTSSAPAPVPTAPAVAAASPRVDVTAASRKSFSSVPSSPVVSTPPMMVVGDLNISSNSIYDDHDNSVGGGGMMTTLQMQMQLEMHQSQIEQLYKRKARAEMDVEDLQAEKARLFDEKVALREEVEQLRRERQELLLLNNGIDDLDGSNGKEVSPLLSSASFLEKMLQDRVSLLLQETARLEEHKRQLERESTNRR
ncbi:hypothetical protein BGZ96_001301 [Linnemannia gamsii]|uniref:PH domain-containing protein n=1 Tax=Linnemannia gamsii TaxID=64522 RepID=A0ABQ7KB33_9FUNG|nr:hypothetical protein BGZ96_001301 [Linnemannia gamsii]